MKRVIVGLVVVAFVFSISGASVVMAQELCEGNFDCDQDVDGTDAAVFKEDFGRSPFFEPCDTCNDSPCPCSPCQLGMTDCNGTCVNTDNDEDNCGDCANPCDSGELCVGGTCVLNCPPGLTNCAGNCVDTDKDKDNCGGCSNTCGIDEMCIDGACTLNCPSGLTNCTGNCFDTDKDEDNCGGCANTCDSGELCVSASCTVSCQPGLTNCGGTCVDTDKDEDNCGGCFNPCTNGEMCVAGICEPVDCGYPAPVEKTGQTTSYATGDDGDLEIGVAWPNPRFTDNLDGTVTDNLTGLIWLKDVNCFGQRTWNNALSDSNGLADASCGLTDGSSAGDWRLANYNELISLIDLENKNPVLPTGHPFNNVLNGGYWSSTTDVTIFAWCVFMTTGEVSNQLKSNPNYYVWPVRGGH